MTDRKIPLENVSDPGQEFSETVGKVLGCLPIAAVIVAVILYAIGAWRSTR